MPAYKDNKTGKWFCKFYYTDWQGNNRQKWKRGFATKKEALAYERDFLEKQSANPDMTFQNLYELYMEDMTARLKKSTILTKKHICETHILPFFGKKPINEIKASDVRRWQNQLMNSPKGYSKTYLKTINKQLTCMINYAKRFYDLNTNPCGQAGVSDRQRQRKWITGLMMSMLLFVKVSKTNLYPISAFRYCIGLGCVKGNFWHLLPLILTSIQSR